jgi:TetR/AcrR family transcriptional regulator, cholesterol catabolism regulator
MVPTPDELAERRRDANREKILQFAAERLSEHGYGATSLADIAILGELEPAVVTFHFPTKEDLVEAVLRAGLDHANDAVDRALTAIDPGASGAERLSTAISAYLQAISAQHHMTRANIRCYRSVPPVVRRGLAVHMREFVETWTQMIEAGRADGSLRADIEPPVVARMVIAALNSAVTWMHTDDIEGVTRQFCAALLHGIAAPSS